MGYGTEMDGCGRFMKYALFLANFIIFIGGVTVAGLAISALTDKVPAIGELLGNELLTGAVYILLVTGVIAAVISFFGCVGASREVKCMLLTYFIIIFLLFVTMLIGGILGYVFRAKIVDNAYDAMKSSMRLYTKKAGQQAWDTVQRSFHCCGTRGWRDWLTIDLPVPDSCCREFAEGKYHNCNNGGDLNNSTAWLDGCLVGTQHYIEKHASTMGAAGIVVACIMFVGMVFSCALFNMIE